MDEATIIKDVVPRTQLERAIEVLNEALSGYSGKSKNTLIKEAIRILKN